MFEEFLVDAIAAPLKRARFRRSHYRWNLKKSNLVFVVTLQNATYSREEELVFRLNFGVAIPEYDQILWPTSKPKTSLSDADCMLRFHYSASNSSDEPVAHVGPFLDFRSWSDFLVIKSQVLEDVNRFISLAEKTKVPRDLLVHRALWSDKAVFGVEALRFALFEKQYGELSISDLLLRQVRQRAQDSSWDEIIGFVERARFQ